jgi:hypothetical protein
MRIALADLKLTELNVIHAGDAHLSIVQRDSGPAGFDGRYQAASLTPAFVVIVRHRSHAASRQPGNAMTRLLRIGNHACVAQRQGSTVRI